MDQREENNPIMITHDCSDKTNSQEALQPIKRSAEPDSSIVKKRRRVMRIISSSDDSGEETVKISSSDDSGEETVDISSSDDNETKEIKHSPRMTKLNLPLPKIRPMFLALPSLRVPKRAVTAHLVPGTDKIATWEIASPNQYKKMTKIWASFKENGNEEVSSGSEVSDSEESKCDETSEDETYNSSSDENSPDSSSATSDSSEGIENLQSSDSSLFATITMEIKSERNREKKKKEWCVQWTREEKCQT